MTKLETFELISPHEWRFQENDEVQENSVRAEEYAQKNFYLENVEHRVEEYIRQWVVRKLIEVYDYPEEWLEFNLPSSRFVNLAIKDNNGVIRAFVAAKFFGDSDSDFDKACQYIQYKLDNDENAFFALITDGKRLLFLRKNDGESINDLYAIADFPTFSELEFFVESGEHPTLPIVNTKFFRLSRIDNSMAAESSNGLSETPTNGTATAAKTVAASAQNSFVANKSQSNNQYSYTSASTNSTFKSGKTIAIITAVTILCLIGAWFSGVFGMSLPLKVMPKTSSKFQIKSKCELNLDRVSEESQSY